MSRILNPGEAERLVTQFLTDTRVNTMARHQAGHEESDRHRASLGLEPFCTNATFWFASGSQATVAECLLVYNPECGGRIEGR